IKQSNSKKFNKAINIMKMFKHYKYNNGVYSIKVYDLFEYIERYQYIDELFYIIKNWKSSKVYLKGKRFDKRLIYYRQFESEVHNEITNIINYEYRIKSVGIDALSLNEYIPSYITFYPPLYGIFFAFKDSFKDDPYLCSCNKKLIEKTKDDTRFLNDNLPKIMRDWLINHKVEEIKYIDNTCFKCNKITPKFDYCHKMYGGKFKRKHGWYINKLFYEKYYGNYTILDSEKYRECENELRLELGVPKIGEGWVNETIMFNIIENIFNQYECIRHYRGDWLEGLEIDLYIPELKLGFEYNGIQHYEPVEHWGGKKHLVKQQNNDKRKLVLCEKNNVNLLVFKYDENISIDLIKERLSLHVFNDKK
ncbi:TPA: hypothetical protein K8055_002340, partial [Staphylococcus pseudintermedius]|nr:hypothetical protein [Staphylococcus pseudintermedius]